MMLEPGSSDEVRQPSTVLVNEVSRRLLIAGIDFGVFSGSHAALIGGHRTTPDIDFWADNQKYDELISAFPDAHLVDRRPVQRSDDLYDGVLLTLGKASIMAGSIINADGKRYPSPFTDLVRQRLTWRQIGNLTTYFVDPADTLLFKAISQRGEDVGKHDLADIAAIARNTQIDKEYLLLRARECEALERIVPLLLSMNILTADNLGGDL